MKYEIILNDDEVEEILNINMNLGDRIKWFKDRYDLKEIKEDKKARFIFNLIQSSKINGNINYNTKDLKCPNCKGKYVVRTYAGDFYYRLTEGTEQQKEIAKQKLDEMGLYSNPWAIKDDFTREYQCLNCGIRWDRLNENIYIDIEDV